jgi:hypothetical protein
MLRIICNDKSNDEYRDIVTWMKCQRLGVGVGMADMTFLRTMPSWRFRDVRQSKNHGSK